MAITGPLIAGQCPAFVQPAVTGTVYRGACKFVGYNTLGGKAVGAGLGTKGLCLGLGLGLGAWGPAILLGVTILGGYLLFKDDDPSPISPPEGRE